MKRPRAKGGRRRHSGRAADEGSYVCPSCGERIVIPLDRSGGAEQRYVEDCPVCCNPNVIRVEFFDGGGGEAADEAEPPRVSAEAE